MFFKSWAGKVIEQNNSFLTYAEKQMPVTYLTKMGKVFIITEIGIITQQMHLVSFCYYFNSPYKKKWWENSFLYLSCNLL